MKIGFISEINNFTLKDKRKLEHWIQSVIDKENRQLEIIEIIFVDSNTIQEINVKYLNHNYPTDIITFNKSFLNSIAGEIYISIDVVKENSKKFSKKSFENELNRVIIHGVLHLIGYDDVSEEQKSVMRKKENESLSYLEKL